MTAYWTKDECAEDYDAWVNELLANTPESYDTDESAEAIVTSYVSDLEGLVRWFLDHASVCVADEFSSPVTISFESDWLVVPDDFHRIVRAYKEAADAGAGEISD
jgi:hypothetical protein